MNVNPQMLTLLRESRGLSQSQLSKLAGVPQPTLSKVENGMSELDIARAHAVAEALRYPPAVLQWTDAVYGFGSAAFHHRKQQSLTQTALRKIHALVNLYRMRVVHLLRGVDIESRYVIPNIDADELGGPRDVARAVRAHWNLPMGPIRSVTRALENAGAVVIRADLESPRISAISTDPGDGPPLFVLNTGQPADRERWSLAHELGHLVMHTMPMSSPEAEAEADAFASEFLLPAAEIRPHLTGIDLRKAAQLKAAWHVSMAALIRAARDLGRIDDTRYRSLNVQMSQRGWRKHEPNEVPREQPAIIPGVLQLHRQDHQYSVGELAELVGLLPDEFAAVYDIPQETGLRLLR